MALLVLAVLQLLMSAVPIWTRSSERTMWSILLASLSIAIFSGLLQEAHAHVPLNSGKAVRIILYTNALFPVVATLVFLAAQLARRLRRGRRDGLALEIPRQKGVRFSRGSVTRHERRHSSKVIGPALGDQPRAPSFRQGSVTAASIDSRLPSIEIDSVQEADSGELVRRTNTVDERAAAWEAFDDEDIAAMILAEYEQEVELAAEQLEEEKSAKEKKFKERRARLAKKRGELDASDSEEEENAEMSARRRSLTTKKGESSDEEGGSESGGDNGLL